MPRAEWATDDREVGCQPSGKVSTSSSSLAPTPVPLAINADCLSVFVLFSQDRQRSRLRRGKRHEQEQRSVVSPSFIVSRSSSTLYSNHRWFIYVFYHSKRSERQRQTSPSPMFPCSPSHLARMANLPLLLISLPPQIATPTKPSSLATTSTAKRQKTGTSSANTTPVLSAAVPVPQALPPPPPPSLPPPPPPPPNMSYGGATPPRLQSRLQNGYSGEDDEGGGGGGYESYGQSRYALTSSYPQYTPLTP